MKQCVKNTIKITAVALACALMLALGYSVAGMPKEDETAGLLSDGSRHTFIWISDTQQYCQSYPEVFSSMTY